MANQHKDLYGALQITVGLQNARPIGQEEGRWYWGSALGFHPGPAISLTHLLNGS